MDAYKYKKSGGYSLVEVMVAMAISLIVLAGVYKTITDETIYAERDEAVLDMQNNARAAMARIASDLRRTGFFGCGGKLSANTDGFSYPPTSIVHGNDDTVAANGFDDGTDSITLSFLSGDVPLDPSASDTTDTSSTKEFTQARKTFSKGDLLLITDCEEYAIFRKTNCSDTYKVRHSTTDDCVSESPALTASELNSSTDLKRAYGAPLPSRIYGFENSIYRVDGASLRLNGDEVAENIEDLQFEFFEDTDNDDDLSDEQWLQTFSNVDDVRAVRVWILAMSETAYTYTDDNTYDYPNSPYFSATNPFASSNGTGGSPGSLAGLANDRKHRYRYLISTIVYLRNAGIS